MFSITNLNRNFVAPLGVATLALFGGVSSASAAHETAVFSDVSPRYADSVDYLVTHHISNGLSKTQFGIEREIKRGDAAIILANALGLMDASAPESGFNDVPSRGVVAINSLKQAGIINGKSAVNFGFDDLIKRGEMALMLTKSTAYDLAGNKENVAFTDVSPRYLEAVAGLMDNQITSGKSTQRFGTAENLQRGEYAIFIYKAEKIKNIRESDKLAPVLNYNGETELTVKYGGTFSMPEVTAKDDIDESVEVTHVIKLGTVEQSEVDVNKSGVYTIAFSAKDKAGNKSEDLIVKVTVELEDMLTPAIEAAELAISELPTAENLSLGDEEEILAARSLVTKVLEIDGQAKVEGIEKLVANETQMEIIKAEEALKEAILAAENAIKDLPEVSLVKLENEAEIVRARELVDAVKALNEQSLVVGIDKLIDVEKVLVSLKKEAELEEAVTKAETAISSLPAVENLTNSDAKKVKNARTLVNAALALDSEVVIEGLDTLEAVEVKMSEIYIPEVSFNTYASITINSRIDAISTSFYNLSPEALTVKKVEVFSGTSTRGTFTEADLTAKGFTTTIQPYQQFGMSVTFGIGIFESQNNYVKYTISNGNKDFEYISPIK